MRPTPEELVGGAVRVLRNEVRPSLDSPRAVQLLDHVTVSVKQVNWDDAAFGLLEETQAIARLLAETRSTFWDFLPPDAQGAVEVALETAQPELQDRFALADLRFASVEARNRSCRHALSAILTGVGWWSPTLPPEAHDVRARLVEHMRRFSGGGYWRPAEMRLGASGTAPPTEASDRGGRSDGR